MFLLNVVSGARELYVARFKPFEKHKYSVTLITKLRDGKRVEDVEERTEFVERIRLPENRKKFVKMTDCSETTVFRMSMDNKVSWTSDQDNLFVGYMRNNSQADNVFDVFYLNKIQSVVPMESPDNKIANHFSTSEVAFIEDYRFTSMPVTDVMTKEEVAIIGNLRVLSNYLFNKPKIGNWSKKSVNNLSKYWTSIKRAFETFLGTTGQDGDTGEAQAFKTLAMRVKKVELFDKMGQVEIENRLKCLNLSCFETCAIVTILDRRQKIAFANKGKKGRGNSISSDSDELVQPFTWKNATTSLVDAILRSCNNADEDNEGDEDEETDDEESMGSFIDEEDGDVLHDMDDETLSQLQRKPPQGCSFAISNVHAAADKVILEIIMDELKKQGYPQSIQDALLEKNPVELLKELMKERSTQQSAVVANAVSESRVSPECNTSLKPGVASGADSRKRKTNDSVLPNESVSAASKLPRTDCMKSTTSQAPVSKPVTSDGGGSGAKLVPSTGKTDQVVGGSPENTVQMLKNPTAASGLDNDVEIVCVTREVPKVPEVIVIDSEVSPNDTKASPNITTGQEMRILCAEMVEALAAEILVEMEEGSCDLEQAKDPLVQGIYRVLKSSRGGTDCPQKNEKSFFGWLGSNCVIA